MESTEKVLISKLNLVDLAGSERIKKSQAEGPSLKEAMCMYPSKWHDVVNSQSYYLDINKSLSFLEQVVVALAKKNREHVPYRQTQLTNVLKDSLGGNCKTFLMANIWGKSPEECKI